jgi:HK97 family phage major capsid protein
MTFYCGKFRAMNIFVRTIRSLAVAKGVPSQARAFAQSQGWGNANQIIESLKPKLSIKSAVEAMGTDDTDDLIFTPASFELYQYTRPQTILGQLSGLRIVPSDVRQISATAGSTAYWAGEKQPRPISRLTFAGETVRTLGVTGCVVSTLELLRKSTPPADSILGRDVGTAVVSAMDSAFIDPANAGETGVKPASITSGQQSYASSGSAVANTDADLEKLILALSDAGSDLSFATWVMLPRTAAYLSRLRGTGGSPSYPGISAKGGTLLGFPVITSTGVPGFGSPSASIIAFLDPSQILHVDDGGGSMEISTEGTIAMADDPSSPAQATSLWQNDSAAIRATRYVNWKRARDNMAVYLSNVNY